MRGSVRRPSPPRSQKQRERVQEGGVPNSQDLIRAAAAEDVDFAPNLPFNASPHHWTRTPETEAPPATSSELYRGSRTRRSPLQGTLLGCTSCLMSPFSRAAIKFTSGGWWRHWCTQEAHGSRSAPTLRRLLHVKPFIGRMSNPAAMHV